MAIQRFDRVLSQAGVQVIPTVGRGFDAQTMRAVETRQVAGVADGVVMEEFLSGFVRGDEVLRPAEVVVNRRQDADKS
jgi:molecular chaperone GrpE